MLRWLTTNLRTFILAFILAVAVWVFAVIAADPDETRQYPSNIPIEFIGQDSGLVLTGPVPTSVQASLRAPRSVWETLTSQKDAIHAMVDLTGLGSGTHVVNVQIQIGVQPVRILSVTPSTLNLYLEKLITRTFPIELTKVGEPAVGYLAGDATLQPGEVVVSGPESLIKRVVLVRAVLDLTAARQAIETSAPLQAVDAEGQVLTGLTINPSKVEVSQPISLQGGYRDLAVLVKVQGQPASGYRLTSVLPFPLIVTVHSMDPELVKTLPGYVETEPLDLTNAKSNIETRLALVLPEGVTVVGEQTVLVQVSISPIEGSITLNDRPVEIINVGIGLEAQVSPELVSVILSGPLPLLDTLRATDVRVIVDASNLTAGTYQLTPTVYIVSGVVIEWSILPGTVEVTIVEIATPTPQ